MKATHITQDTTLSTSSIARTRRGRIPGALVLVLLLGFEFCPLGLAATPRNILLLIADDYGVDSSSLYNSTNAGASLPPTPNLVALAQRGVRFRNAYAHPVCSPTRAAVITGRHGFRTGIGDVIEGAGSPVLTAAEFTLPEAFAANAGLGYQLAHFGKWHLNNQRNSPNAIGNWPHYAGNLLGALTNYSNWNKTVNGSTTGGYTNYATSDVVTDAIAWIQGRGTAPWFAWVAFNAPHAPYHKPPTNLAPHYATLPGTQGNINANPRPYYEAGVEAMDTEIGRLLNAVDRATTHVIFMGDNGTPANVLQPPFPSGRGKGTLYEGGIRVPLIIAGPDVVQTNRVSDALVHAVDLFATILELAGISTSATVPTNVTLDARGFSSVLHNEAYAPSRLYAEVFDTTTPTSGGRALRDERYKLIRFKDGHDEFYDLQADPYEAANLLAAALTAEQQKYRDRLEFWLAGYNTTTGPRIASPQWISGHFSASVPQAAGASYTLWRCEDLAAGFWSPVSGALIATTNSVVTLTDPVPPASRAFYSVIEEAP